MPNSQGRAAGGTETPTLPLPRKLDRNAAIALARDLMERRGADLLLDATRTAVLGTLAVQTILAAQKSWRRSGHTLRLTCLGPECREQLGLLGFTPQTLVGGTER